jgi:hypothetical protein
MTFSKAGRLPVLAAVLCVLLMGFAATSYGAVTFNVPPSPTEVINTGLSEVTGSISLFVTGENNITGTSNGGDAQIGILYNSNGTYMPIDNTTTTGIRIFYTSGFVSAGVGPTIVSNSVANVTINGYCSGTITINIPAGRTPAANDFIRVEGVRGRIAASSAATQGNDLYASLQSINDPAANAFVPDTVRVAKSFPGMTVGIESASPLLCFPTTGVPTAGEEIPEYAIVVTEGFARAFVDMRSDSEDTSYPVTPGTYDRVDHGGPLPAGSVPGALGDPTNSTEITVVLSGIPASVDEIIWDDSSHFTGGGTGDSYLKFVEGDDAPDADGNAAAVFSYETDNQTNHSDINIENFTIQPILALSEGATEIGTVQATTTLSPNGGSAACQKPGNKSSTDVRPRFTIQYQPDTPADYAKIIRCNCFMLFTYVTTAGGFNTGIVVANTSQDYTSTQPTDNPVFPKGTGAANEIGYITFYFYSTTGAYRGYYKTPNTVSYGQSFVALLSQMLGTTTMPDTSFSGYIIAKAEFQYCHAISYIADDAFAATAQGYAALIIPDPAILRTGKREAADSGDVWRRVPAGEGLNN